MKLLSRILGDGLQARSIRSSLLTGLSFGAANLIRLGGNLILTRILFPEAFGIMALVQVVMTGLNMFSDIGVRASIIQNARGEDPRFLDTAWIIQIARGVILWALTWAFAAPVATFYEAPILAELLPVAGLVALFQGLASTKLITANRNLALGRVTVIQIGTSLVGLAVVIALALAWKSVWALVIGSLVAPFLVMLLSHMALPGINNRMRFDASAATELVGFGKYIFFSTLAGFLISQADRALLGKFVSLSDLALYNIAFMFASIPVMIMRKMNDVVLFPLYSRRPPSESAVNGANIARARGMVLGVVMAMVSVLAIGGNLLIDWLYDPRYAAAGALMVLIAIASMPTIVIGSYGSMVLAAGHSGRYAVLQVLSALLRILVLFVGVYYFGAIGAALAPIFAVVLYYVPMVLLILPYGGWLPKQDITLTTIAVAISAMAIWLNWPALETGWTLFVPH